MINSKHQATVEKLKFLHTKLKCGEYDGTDLMQAWIAIENLIETLKRNTVLKEQLRLVAKNLQSGMSKSIQRVQAKAILDVLDEN